MVIAMFIQRQTLSVATELIIVTIEETLFLITAVHTISKTVTSLEIVDAVTIVALILLLRVAELVTR